MKYIKKYNDSKIKNPHQMMIGYQYKLTEPDYDDVGVETDIVEVIKKTSYGLILKNIEHGFTYERTFQHLMNCKIENVK